MYRPLLCSRIRGIARRGLENKAISTMLGFAVACDPRAEPRLRVKLDGLNHLMRQTGDTPTELFHKALALYKLATDAIREGKEVWIVSTPDSLETRFVGL